MEIGEKNFDMGVFVAEAAYKTYGVIDYIYNDVTFDKNIQSYIDGWNYIVDSSRGF